MDECDNDASASAIDLSSPKVLDKTGHSGDDDSMTHLPSRYSENTLNSVLSKESKAKREISRRVSFPEDDKIISGYGEPRNPWAQAKSTSTEELIQAYTQSCQHWGVKPITKLLVQLQEIKDFSVRTHSLTLKGEKLDFKVVETLEAVFKRVQFVIMDVEATSLDEDAAAALFDMIEYYESAVNVLIGFNKNLGTRGWQAAAHMMRKMSCLRLFDGHNVPLTEQAVPFVGRALRLSNTLVTLHLEGASLSGRPILLIVTALRMNVTLRELFLADNRLVSTDALQIANLLKFNTVLQLLDVRNNLIQDAGLCHLCMGLMNQPHPPNTSGGHPPVTGGGLHTLVLWNNQISHQSMPKLSAALKHTPSLTTLNLGQNVLSDDGAARLKEGLLQNRSLLRLGMVGTKLTCEGAIALAEFLAESSRIIRLDLRNNDIKFGGLMALSLAFKINFSLLRLDIDKPQSKETLKELVERQETLLTNIHDYSDRNKKQALQKVVTVQMERQKKSEDETNVGLRYMDMTNSNGVNVGASTSQNNSNNKLTSHQSNRVVVRSSEVDDSPMNSPEFLPANSVSYHEVSPVMFSNSEMQKRAELAKQEAKVSNKEPNLQTEVIGDSIAQGVAKKQSSELKETTHIQLDPATLSQGDANIREIIVSENSSSDSNETPCACSETLEDSDSETTHQPAGTNPEITQIPFTDSSAESVQLNSSDSETHENTPSDNTAESVAENDENSIAENSPIKLSSPSTTAIIESNDEKAENNGVTITHFDLSLFPKD